ncbi:MAG: ABC transporter ATP-binding protein [Burkholderiaceae bacterium]|nr:ABC transporter ATP-binding protein [Burkholderiaceae bacterium]
MLRIRDLSIALPPGSDRQLAVDRVSLDLQAGETLCVVGESGSGKSLTASAIVGLLPSPRLKVRSGSILFEGRDTLRMSEAELRAVRGGRIGYVFQDPMSSLNPLERIGKQIREVLELHAWAGDPRRRVVEVLRDVHLPCPESLVDVFPWQLSGGQRQRVMIAMAIASEPAMIVADEPTSALDVTTQAQILALLRELRQRRGIALFLITHDFGVVNEMADRVAVMRNGVVVEEGAKRDVLARARDPYTRRLLGAVPELRARTIRRAEPYPPLLRADHLTKTWRTRGRLFGRGREVKALDSVSLEVGQGETLAVVGESGSGKSTLARALCCLTRVDHGRADLHGTATDYLSLPARSLQPVRRAIQLVFQDPYSSLNPRRTVGQSIEIGLRANGESAAAARARTVELLARVQLDPAAADRYPNEFSGGQRQRIVIARALAMRPKLLVADEPVSALDVSVQAEILDLLDSLQQEEGLAMLFITHDLRVAARMADRALVMRGGMMVETSSMERVLADPEHEYTASLVRAVPRMTEAGSVEMPALIER